METAAPTISSFSADGMSHHMRLPAVRKLDPCMRPRMPRFEASRASNPGARWGEALSHTPASNTRIILGANTERVVYTPLHPPTELPQAINIGLHFRQNQEAGFGALQALERLPPASSHPHYA